MHDDAQERQHQATGKHITEMKKRGNVMRSRDLSGGLLFIVGVITLMIMSARLIEMMKNNFTMMFTSFQKAIIEPDYLLIVLKKIILTNFYEILPVFVISFVVTLFSPFLFGGWNFTMDAIHFKLAKLNPIDNLSKLFSIKSTMMEVIRAFIKSNFLLTVLVCYFFAYKNEVIMLINEPCFSAIYSGSIIIKNFILVLSCSIIVIVIFDVIYHYLKYQQQSKMSTQQIKDENKEVEGNPESKRKMRSKQIALLKQRLTQTVPKANVIITNPTHYSIALRYDNTKDHAPRVVAKGKGLIAHQIKQIAIAHAITIYEAPELARAIYHTTKLGEFIHPGLYKAVAIVLSYVFQLKHYQMGKGVQPEFIRNLDIPKEFIYQE